jgi:NitT/TauT family transport system ATP-binding protein
VQRLPEQPIEQRRSSGAFRPAELAGQYRTDETRSMFQPQTEALITVSNVNKIYASRDGDRIAALDDVSFSIADGEFIVLVGPSGCGKTTLLKILSGLLKPTHGEVTLQGTRITGPRPDIGIVFQHPVLLPWRTVLDNVMLPIEVLGLKKQDYRQTAQELIRLVGLEGFEHKYPYQLSGGMQQRNGIVRSLVFDPSLLLMDEPFGALDAMTRENMNIELLRIWDDRRKTVFFITHSIPEAAFLADRVFVMSPRPGRIVGIVDIDIPRPRDRDTMSTPEFGRLTKQIRELLEKAGANV